MKIERFEMVLITYIHISLLFFLSTFGHHPYTSSQNKVLRVEIITPTPSSNCDIHSTKSTFWWINRYDLGLQWKKQKQTNTLLENNTHYLARPKVWWQTEIKKAKVPKERKRRDGKIYRQSDRLSHTSNNHFSF